MAAIENNHAFSFEEIDVFTVPHNRMKKLLVDVSNQVISDLYYITIKNR